MTDSTSAIKPKRTAKQNVILGVKIALNVVFYSIIVLILIFSIANIRSKNQPDQIPNIFGSGYLTVQSNSMEGSEKDSFNKGDLIIVDIASEKDINNLKIGDIITFKDDNLSGQGAAKKLNTHRLIYMAEENGVMFYYTVGDRVREQWERINNTTLDYKSESFQNQSADEVISILTNLGNNAYQISVASDIRGIYKSKMSGVGNVIDTINNNFLVCIVLPIVLFLIFEIGVFIYNIMAYKNEKNKLATNNKASVSEDEISRIKEQLRNEIMKEIEKKDNNENKEE